MLRKLEKYEIYEELGHGGMATVYRARDTVLDRQVALKVMHPHLRGAEQARRRFHREAQSVARLRHPRVLEIYDFSGTDSEEAFIATELLTGPTLKRWREDQADVPAEVAACLVIEICRALEAAHAAGIVHRDVKPENVLLHEARVLKLTDFGIADMMDAQSMTATGQILGSPGHMAPEQIEGGHTDERTDLFSLGTVLYYLATGELPFTGKNPHQILRRIMDTEYPDPLRVNPRLGGPMRVLIAKALSLDPSARFQTAAEFREALEALVSRVGIEDPEQLVVQFLRDPDATVADLEPRLIARLTELGRQASDRGDIPSALDFFNRVLALDDGNAVVLRLIQKVGVSRRLRTVRAWGAGLALVGLAASGGAWAIWTQGPPTPPARTPPSDETGMAATPLDAGGQDAGVSATGRDASVSSTFSDAAVQVDASRRPTRLVARTRRVRFRSAQPNCSIGIDGAAPRPFEDIGELELSVGRHRVQIVPGLELRESHAPRTIDALVRPGVGVQVISVSLGVNPALLVVRSQSGARIRVTAGGGQIRGRGSANQPFRVTMRGQQERLRVTVEADGFEPSTLGPVLVRAGGSHEFVATLRRVSD